MSAQIAQRRVVKQRGSRLGDKHLAAMTGGHDPRGPVHIHPDVIRSHQQWVAGMNAHPHPQFGVVRPFRRSQRPLPSRSRLRRVLSPPEHNEERVPLRPDLVPAVTRKRLPQQPAVTLEHHHVPLGTQPLQQSCRALDVGKQQSDGSYRLLRHAAEYRSAANGQQPALPAQTGKPGVLLRRSAFAAPSS